MDEFGFGTFGVNTEFSIAKNPYDKSRSCGGSSSGAGCLTAVAPFKHIAIAVSTGGSISCPASFTGTVGLTPTYGRVSRFGLIDYANSLDKIGCIARSVYDAALALSVISGKDDKDPTTLSLTNEDFTSYCKEVDEKFKVAVPREYVRNLEEGVQKVFWRTISKLENEKLIEYSEISLPLTEYAIPAYYIIAMAEASTNLARYCGLCFGQEDEFSEHETFEEYFRRIRTKYFGKEAKRRIIAGTFVRMAGYRNAYYVKALKVRNAIIKEFKNVFAKYDFVLSPTMPILPPKFEDIEKLSPVEIYSIDILTIPPNLAGLPTISLNGGFYNGLPVGIHIISNHFEEGKLIKFSYNVEKVLKT